MGLFKRLVDAFLLLVVKSPFIFSELFAGSSGKGMCWVAPECCMSVVMDWEMPLLDVAVMDSVPWRFFSTSQSLFHHSNLNLNQQAFIQPLFVPVFERVNKQLCLDCYLKTMLGDCFVLSQLSLAVQLIIVQVSASNDIYCLLPNPWDSLWKATGWNIWPLQHHMCDLCYDSLGRVKVGKRNTYNPLHCRVSLAAVKDHALVSAALNIALCC